MFKAALFDLDGTLTDSMNLSAQAFIYSIKKHLNKDYTPEQVFALFGPGEEEIFLRLDPRLAPDMMDTFLAVYRSRHQELASTYPGVVPLLDWLRGRIPSAVITGKGRSPALITIEELGLKDYFQVVVTGSCVFNHKPHPEGIFQALARMQTKPDQAFYLGDSPGDIKTARRAGVTALAALWGARDRELLLKQEPDHAFASPEEFLAWLQQL